MSPYLPDFAAAAPAALGLAAAGGYLAGSIPFGPLVARVFGLGDLRKIGSGNIGATNVLRTGSKGAAAATLLLDMAKGWAPAALALWLAGPATAAVAAVAAVLGHVFPVWLKFRGGKGVATFLGALLGLAPLAGLLSLTAWLAAAAAFRYSSLAALLMTLAAPFWLMRAGAPWAVGPVIGLALLLWLTHRANIGRLLRGEEPKIGGK